jgi:hypothetical protein
MIPSFYTSAVTWLERGAWLLPTQKGTKYLVEGFGPNKLQVKTAPQCRYWWGGEDPYNLAVMCRQDMFCLDFDDLDLFRLWWRKLPARYKSYLERSRKGIHVFYNCLIPGGLGLVPGVEVKRVVVVSPSSVWGVTYEIPDPSMRIIPVLEWQDLIFPLLLSKKEPEKDRAPVPSKGHVKSVRIGSDLISQIKQAFPVLDLASSLTKLNPTSNNGRFYMGLCPLHEDHHPSFWVDTLQNRWGCFGCRTYGDVINLYSQVKKIPLDQAIKVLAAELRKMQVGA